MSRLQEAIATFFNRLLFVDDDEGIRAVMHVILSSATPFTVDVASNGMDALALARDNNYDVAITDYQMPGIDGIETSIGLRALHPSMIIIMTSGAWLDERVMARIRSVTNGFFPKPIDSSKLMPRLQLILTRYALHVMQGRANEAFLEQM